MTTATDRRENTISSHTLPRPRVRPEAVAEERPRAAVRIEIQALRAAAVLLVVLYHLWPLRLTGGFVGVDVFFVISGFLISGHLLRELTTTGAISLPRFWARRARRLLPASLLVLLVVFVVTVTAVPDSYWRQWTGEIGASAVYGQNWLLAFNAVDYLAAENAASPVQHFWSLSLEEQFYVVWPVLLVVARLLSRKRTARVQRVVLLGVLIVVAAASLVTSVVWTEHLQASAYFVTPTRMWEFALGGLLAFTPRTLAVGHRVLASAVSLLGFAVIGWSAMTFTGAMAFPGYIALLPVLGTVAVIAAGSPTGALSPAPLLALRPVQFLGDLSYSLYLWHWPAIVILPVLAGAPLTTDQKVFILCASLLLAWFSKVQIEDRFRNAPAVQRLRPRWMLASALTAGLALIGAGSVAVQVLDARIAQSAEDTLQATSGGCFGAAAMDPANGCRDPFADTGSMTPAFAKTDTNYVADPRGGWKCETPRGESALRPCEFGNTTDPSRTVAMLGDSHAMHYLAALEAVADARGWRVVTYFKSACSGTGASDVVHIARPDDQQPCADWGRSAQQAIIGDPSIDTVLFANVSEAYSQDAGAHAIQPPRYVSAWNGLTAAGKQVLVIRDLPRAANDADVPDCISSNAGNTAACDSDQGVSLHPDAAARAAVSAGEDVRVLDLTDKYCRDGVCHARIGGAIVYSDSSHLTNTFARSLAPYVAKALSAGE
jgi:peptidoglycan/LPS O-acetylase OafA/YrhL